MSREIEREAERGRWGGEGRNGCQSEGEGESGSLAGRQRGWILCTIRLKTHRKRGQDAVFTDEDNFDAFEALNWCENGW